jgi:Uma2 family endonuclease
MAVATPVPEIAVYQPLPPLLALDEDGFAFSDGEPMEDPQHGEQAALLRTCLEHYWANTLGYQSFYVGFNMFHHYGTHGPLNRDFRGPDFFVVRDVEFRPRRNWVVRREGKKPCVVLEVLSDTTRDEDLGKKKRIYQNILETPEWVWLDMDTNEWQLHRLVQGSYQRVDSDANGRVLSRELGLCLGPWHGEYARAHRTWLRWWTPDGVLLPTPAEASMHRAEAEHERAEAAHERAEAAQERAEAAQERAEAAQERAEAAHERAEAAQEQARAERERAEAEQRRAERLVARLRELGVDPE